jgi:hypothetical protein
VWIVEEMNSGEVGHDEFQPQGTQRRPVIRREFKTAIYLICVAVFIIAAFFLTSPKHRNPPQPMSPEQKDRAMQAENALAVYENGQPVAQTKPDPDAFDEKRDGSHVLYEEDEDGGSKIFADKTSGARIVCATDSGPCLILPPALPTTKHDKGKGKTSGL